MKCPQLVFVCWCSSILTVTGFIQVDGYSCVSAYRNTITCVLNISENPVEQSNWSLKFKFTDLLSGSRDEVSCPLLVVDHSYSCVCKVKDDDDYFNVMDNYDIELCNKSDCQSLTEEFYPSTNVQLTPPHEPEIQPGLDTVNITWTSGYEDHMYFSSGLEYELSLQTSQSKESKPRLLHSRGNFLSVASSELHATYCFKVRSKPESKNPDYEAIWSKWSRTKCWKNGDGEKQQDNILVILTKSLGPVFVAAGVLLFVYRSPAARMKIKTLSQIPTPAPFFQPLFQQHEGNLKEWLSPQGKYVLTYKTEEIMATDAVIVVPKPLPKDPDDNQGAHNPLVNHVPFIQCQTSYVGLPGLHEPPPPLTMVCPGDMSYTQLPCSVWGVGFGGVGFKEVEVASSPPKDVLNISRADSGCSCEDLTQSPECSLPNSPVDDSPPPPPPLCNCTDYCILNKTAEGFAPVLVSKGDSINVPSAALQETKS